MAVVYITEFSGTGSDAQELVPAAKLPIVASQTVAIGGASAQSVALQPGTKLIRIKKVPTP